MIINKMQTLFSGIFGNVVEVIDEVKNDVIDNQMKDFENLGCPEYQMINQIHRKIKLIKDLDDYLICSYSDKNSIFYNYMLNTTIYTNSETFIIRPDIFGMLYMYKLSNYNIYKMFLGIYE
jgi:hypothetical protein